MGFPLPPPIEPMLAKPLAHRDGQPDWPDPRGMRYEPKWDGFRILVYRDGSEVALQGRMRAADSAATGKWDLTYAFPELVSAVQALPTPRFVADGELICRIDGRLAFDALGMRLRPRSESGGWKIRELAEQYPTEFVGYDLLAQGEDDLRDQPLEARRRRLVGMLGGSGVPSIHLTPHTDDEQLGRRWFQTLPGAGLDGVILKASDLRYLPGKRVMLKAKHSHTADVVAAGWRPYARPGADGSPVVGSILLGVYDAQGELTLVGAASAFSAARRAELAQMFASYAAGPDHPWADSQGRAAGQASRWSAGRDAHWFPLRPELVCEVTYDQFTNGRFRHVAGFLRWRPDRDPLSATVDQLVVPVPLDVRLLLDPQAAAGI